ncbi:MAG: hypothetical protein ACT4OT_09495 [Acidobacteriota bacterium]
MIKKFVSFATVVALVCCFCGISVYANGTDPRAPVETLTPAEKSHAQEKLKADVKRLVADAQAGKLKAPVQHFPQPKRNNLSTGAKIGTIAGIGRPFFSS